MLPRVNVAQKAARRRNYIARTLLVLLPTFELRVLGPVGATTVVVGSVIGSGIFFKANVIAQSVGRFELVILVWLVCGVMSLLGALAFAELGAMMPHAGGQYVYLREGYGPLSGFLWGWGHESLLAHNRRRQQIRLPPLHPWPSFQ